MLELIPDVKKRSTVTMATLFDDQSGFEPFFRKNSQLASWFIKAHGLLHELAKLVVVCEKAKQLAGQGGDLLVYGLANAQVNNMLNGYSAIVKAIRAAFERLNQMAEVRFEQLVDANQARESANDWVPHYRKVSYLFEQMEEDLAKADQAAAHIRTQANAMTLEERFQKAKEETNMFVMSFLNERSHVLNCSDY
jgi:hypothetical protein